MKDNFDLKKFLVENKSIEKYNPYLKEEMSDAEKEKVDREVDAVKDDLDQISKLAKDAGEDAQDIKSSLKERIREMIISELNPENPDYADYDELEDLGDDESIAAQLGTDDYLMDEPSEEAPEEEEIFIDPAGGIHDADEDDYAAMYLDEAKEEEEEEEVEAKEEAPEEEGGEEEVEAEEEVDVEAGGGIEDLAADMEGDEGDLMNNLMNALKISKGMDNEKLTTQIGNTLKFFVGEYIGGEE